MAFYKSKLCPEGVSKHQLYEIYRAMLARCLDPRDPSYRYYGARGLRISPRWRRPKGQGFVNFLKDLGPRPTSQKTPGGVALWWLERENNSLGYGPSNCRWATASEQNRNRRRRQGKNSSQ